jgi:hypothetical protein
MATGSPRQRDQYVIRSVSTDRYGNVYTAFYGPYTGFSLACSTADALAERYLREPIKLDGEPTTTDFYTETLIAPPRIGD